MLSASTRTEWKLDPADSSGYLCGHPQMIELGRGILLRGGYAKESVREEVYWVPPNEISNPDGRVQGASLRPSVGESAAI